VLPIRPTVVNVPASPSLGLEAAATPVASPPAVQTSDVTYASPGSAVRVGDLSAGGPLLSVVTLAEVESAYRLNDAEPAPTSGMLVPLGYIFDK
jgi:hypothetical protein